MTREELEARWACLKAGIRGLLAGLAGLPADQRAWIEECLDHNELGLAFESLCHTLVASQVPIAASQHDELLALQEMIRSDLVESLLKDLAAQMQ